MIFNPPCKSGKLKHNAKLIYIHEEKLYILEKDKKNILEVCYHFKDIQYIETGRLLLLSWIMINGVCENRTISTTIFYDTVVDLFFKHILILIRKNNFKIENNDISPEIMKFEELIYSNYKFMNFARQSIIPGEKVIEYFFQPEIKQIKFKIFNKPFYKILSNTYILILTDRELIFIKDYGYMNSNYGGIWEFYNLEKIKNVQIDYNSDNYLSNFNICLILDENVNLNFEAKYKEKIEHFAQKINQTIGTVESNLKQLI
jgi:hypothetical protein